MSVSISSAESTKLIATLYQFEYGVAICTTSESSNITRSVQPPDHLVEVRFIYVYHSYRINKFVLPILIKAKPLLFVNALLISIKL